MRRSFGGGSNRMGGGGILRTAMRAGGVGGGGGGGSGGGGTCSTNITKLRKAYADRNTNSAFTLTSSNTSNRSSPFTSPPRYRSVVEENDWEYVNGNCMDDNKRGGKCNKYLDDFVFGTVPSVDEVQHALCDIQKVALNLNEEEEAIGGCSELDWIEPALCSPMELRHCGFDRVEGVLDLLNADPSVQKMVVSISSDEAIWNAVLNNEAVREFRDSVYGEKTSDADKRLCSSDDSNPAKDIAGWVVNQIKAKLNQLLENIMLVFHELFQSSDKMNEGKAMPFEGKLRSSFYLSLVVMLMVVVTRAHGA